MDLAQLYTPITKELARVESLIEGALIGVLDPNLRKMNSLVLQSKGKRLRPAFAILTAYTANEGAAQKNEDALIKTAAAFELIHMATLVHDDVMDENELRHGRSTINKMYGNASAIGVGDYLFSKAFVLLSETKNAEIVRIASQAIAEVCEGQIYQLSRRGSIALTIEEGRIIIEKKTAALFAAACAAGATFAKGDADAVRSAREFGHHFGVAFQLVDDYLDIMGTRKMLGKEPGENLHEGEMTIPLITLLEKMDLKERNALKKTIFTKESVPVVKKAMVSYQVGKDISRIIQQEIDSAKQGLGQTNRYAQSLLVVCSLLEEKMAAF